MDKIITTFWNYNRFSDFRLEMLNDWAELGINTPVAPGFRFRKDSHEDYMKMLDEAERLGLKLILQIDQCFICGRSEEDFRRSFSEAYNEFGHHSAVAGFYVGEEPNSGSNDEYMRCVRVMKEVAPEMMIYINLGSLERTERMLTKGKMEIADWVREYKKNTGSNIIGFGCYSQLMTDNTGIDEFFMNLRTFGRISREQDVDIWATVLSSAHDFYRIPTEDDYRWQLGAAVACGCKAVVWFRLYDKIYAGDYRGSPIDEFGVKTTHFYDLARVQKKFNIRYGRAFAGLKHIETYGIGVSYGGFPYLTPNELIESASGRSGFLSLFKDAEGSYYVSLFNNLQKEAGQYSVRFTDKVKSVSGLAADGETFNVISKKDGNCNAEIEQSCYSPGMIELFKLGV